MPLPESECSSSLQERDFIEFGPRLDEDAGSMGLAKWQAAKDVII
jgi:hypothetical protein